MAAQPKPYVPGEALGEQADEQRRRQADDVEVVALDPLDEARAEALDRVRAGASLPLAAATYVATSRGVSVRNVTRVTSRPHSSHAGVTQAQPETTSCVRPESAFEHLRRIALVARLAEQTPVAAAPPCRRRARAGRPPRRRPTAPSPRACSTRIDAGLLLVVGRDDVERDPQLLEDRPPLRRRRREDQRRASGGARARSLRSATSSPTPRSSGSTRGRPRRPAANSSTSRSTSKPFARRTSIQSPWPSWNSISSGALHSMRCSPRCGRWSVSTGPPSAVPQSTASVELRRKTSCPPGRSSRAASGIHFARIAPDRRAVLRDDEVEDSRPAARSPRRSPRRTAARARTRPPSARAVSSCAGVTSTPTTPRAAPREPRAEVRGAAAELDDVLPVDLRAARRRSASRA